MSEQEPAIHRDKADYQCPDCKAWYSEDQWQKIVGHRAEAVKAGYDLSGVTFVNCPHCIQKEWQKLLPEDTGSAQARILYEVEFANTWQEAVYEIKMFFQRFFRLLRLVR